MAASRKIRRAIQRNSKGRIMQASDGSTHVPVSEPQDVIEEIFTYHAPTGDQPERYKRIREAAMNLARVIDRDCPAGADRTAAIRKVSEAVMTANGGIARNGVSYR
jgi:hypothetical protein